MNMRRSMSVSIQSFGSGQTNIQIGNSNMLSSTTLGTPSAEDGYDTDRDVYDYYDESNGNNQNLQEEMQDQRKEIDYHKKQSERKEQENREKNLIIRDLMLGNNRSNSRKGFIIFAKDNYGCFRPKPMKVKYTYTVEKLQKKIRKCFHRKNLMIVSFYIGDRRPQMDEIDLTMTLKEVDISEFDHVDFIIT